METPPGSIVSPLLFSLLINDVFNNIEGGMGFSLFADFCNLGKTKKKCEINGKEGTGSHQRWSSGRINEGLN